MRVSQEEGEKERASRRGGDGAINEESEEGAEVETKRKPFSAKPRKPSLTPP